MDKGLQCAIPKTVMMMIHLNDGHSSNALTKHAHFSLSLSNTHTHIRTLTHTHTNTHKHTHTNKALKMLGHKKKCAKL